MPSHTAPIFVTRLSRGLSHILSRTPTSGYTPTSAFPDIRAHTGIGVHPDIGVYPDIGGHPNIGVNPDFEVHLCGLCRPMLTVCSTAPGYHRSCDTAAILRHRGAPRYSPPGGPCTRNKFVPNYEPKAEALRNPCGGHRQRPARQNICNRIKNKLHLDDQKFRGGPEILVIDARFCFRAIAYILLCRPLRMTVALISQRRRFL